MYLYGTLVLLIVQQLYQIIMTYILLHASNECIVVEYCSISNLMSNKCITSRYMYIRLNPYTNSGWDWVNSFARRALGAPRKAVELGHLILLNVLSNTHSNSFQKYQNLRKQILGRRQPVATDWFERESVQIIRENWHGIIIGQGLWGQNPSCYRLS